MELRAGRSKYPIDRLTPGECLKVKASVGALAMKSGRIGESVVAHATTNALLGAYVFMFDQWQLW